MASRAIGYGRNLRRLTTLARQRICSRSETLGQPLKNISRTGNASTILVFGCRRLSLREGVDRVTHFAKMGAKQQAEGTISWFTYIQHHIKAFLALGALGTAVSTFGYGLYKATMYTSSLSIHDTARAGFLAGLLSATAAWSGFVYFRRLVSIHPDKLFSNVMRNVTAHKEVSKTMGEKLHAGRFKAYSYYGGLTYNAPETRTKPWRIWSLEPYGCQLLFPLVGDSVTSMVAVDAHQTFGTEIFLKSTSITLPDGNIIIVDGKEEDLFYQGHVQLR